MLEESINNYFTNKKVLSRDELLSAITHDFPNLSANTITVYLSRLKKEGLISNPSRGYYSISTKKVFKPDVNLSLKKIYNKIRNELPFASYCIWHTKWLNDFMLHQPFKNYVIFEVEKDVAEQVFHKLSDFRKHVYLNPDEQILERYIANNNEEVIIVKNLVTEAPLTIAGNITIPALEKLLVDIAIEKDLFSAQQGELATIYSRAFEKYDINILKMKRYALRRNKENEIGNLISLFSAK